MATERKSGAGSRLGSVLERATPLNDQAEPEPDDVGAETVEAEAVETVEPKGRGATPAKKPKPAEARVAKRIKGRTVYIPDDLFERILVQSHRRNKTISEYITAILERQVPDHRVVRAETPDVA